MTPERQILFVKATVEILIAVALILLTAAVGHAIGTGW